jgi:small multidrug resistance family-3 protein
MQVLRVLGLFTATALAEIVGCYLPYLWLRKAAPVWVLVPAALSLALFVWLLSLHPHAAGRTYAAYGGIYIAVALGWLWAVDGVRPDRWDFLGVALSLLGMAVIYFAPRAAS